jgi:predicted ArsR family transcriptional regulator
VSEADERYHAALASSTRRKVLDALVGSRRPLDAQAIADDLDLHVTTVRFHLEQLEEARLVSRHAGAEKRRGRPRMLYTATPIRADDSREQLIYVLAAALSAGKDGGRARSVDAGKRWADALEPNSASIADRVSNLVDVLDRLGFEPHSAAPHAENGVIHLRGCPFRDAARDHPEIVCSVHRGLIERLLDCDADTQDVRLLPFVEPELCLITYGGK